MNIYELIAERNAKIWHMMYIEKKLRKIIAYEVGLSDSRVKTILMEMKKCKQATNTKSA